MRAAHQLGLFGIRTRRGSQEPIYSNDAASATLMKSHPSSVRALVRPPLSASPVAAAVTGCLWILFRCTRYGLLDGNKVRMQH